MTHDCLKLRLVCLQPAEVWPIPAGQFSFLFSKGRPGQFVSGSKAHRFSIGEVLVVNPAGPGQVCAEPAAELTFWFFSMRLENLYPLFSGHDIARLQTISEDFKGVKWYAASQPAAIECHRRLQAVLPSRDLRHRSELLHVAATILSADSRPIRPLQSGFVNQEQHLIQVFERLSVAEILELSMDALAARFGCCRRHLNRLFHKCFGCSVATLRMELRLLRAVSQLERPGVKVIDVAIACGFNHLGVFNVCFKRRFGVSPGQWRKTKAASKLPSSDSAGREHHCALSASGRCSLHE